MSKNLLGYRNNAFGQLFLTAVVAICCQACTEKSAEEDRGRQTEKLRDKNAKNEISSNDGEKQDGIATSKPSQGIVVANIPEYGGLVGLIVQTASISLEGIDAITVDPYINVVRHDKKDMIAKLAVPTGPYLDQIIAHKNITGLMVKREDNVLWLATFGNVSLPEHVVEAEGSIEIPEGISIRRHEHLNKTWLFLTSSYQSKDVRHREHFESTAAYSEHLRSFYLEVIRHDGWRALELQPDIKKANDVLSKSE